MAHTNISLWNESCGARGWHFVKWSLAGHCQSHDATGWACPPIRSWVTGYACVTALISYQKHRKDTIREKQQIPIKRRESEDKSVEAACSTQCCVSQLNLRFDRSIWQRKRERLVLFLSRPGRQLSGGLRAQLLSRRSPTWPRLAWESIFKCRDLSLNGSAGSNKGKENKSRGCQKAAQTGAAWRAAERRQLLDPAGPK